jgi:hypothetical protein
MEKGSHTSCEPRHSLRPVLSSLSQTPALKSEFFLGVKASRHTLFRYILGRWGKYFFALEG